MNDRDLMECLLIISKAEAGLCLHGTIESATSDVHSTFNDVLCEVLKVQNEIYNKMSSKGWYPTEQAEQEKISKVKQKFLAQQ
ncbi:spore coat protein [Clostridium ihumii]|uniref:spore coat protein n=1 Tax=Clostridium ihumii TaxID=1470356 RepID=UPI00058C6A17|nr:spore coat protein [Clostridium ihumii]